MAVDEFLANTSKWTPRWFNKSKFHVILHISSHIRRFGPAMLFATEAFESFNAVIRAKSIHSNHHAPSRDIAIAFAQANRVKHFLSGARILVRSATKEEQWKAPGPGPLSLVSRPNAVTRYLGLNTEPGKKYGTFHLKLSTSSSDQ